MSVSHKKYGNIAHYTTGCSLIIVFFFNFVIFLNSAISAAALLVFYLPGVCTHTDKPTENRERPESEIFLKSSGKHTIINEHPVV